ncbi:MAG: saccharopine dehydrogenase NADP-binding domain-containing protein [Candidatus Aminicenantes bacterium]|nr:saccharopine dehydrogenase NADP-binding domain-containing protein [Candidatus Aminicenantes bacterium]
MKRVIIFGSGLVSKPGIHYLLDRKNMFVTVASNEPDKAAALVKGRKNGKALFCDVTDTGQLESLIKENDIVVSLLPATFHPAVARLCLKNNKSMATASYAGSEVRALDSAARSKGLLFLNEVGVDPGIDHMSAKKVIDQVYAEGGKVIHFYSFCGGLPAPEHNDNPFGYKFSWSPYGVLAASKRPARYLENGEVIEIDGSDLFSHFRLEKVNGLGTFEVYPNGDSLPYKEIYGLKDAQTLMRGTYRYPGWCETLKKIVEIGLIDETPVDNLAGTTFKKMTARLIGAGKGENIVRKTAEKIGLPENSTVIEKLKWLGLFDDKPVSGINNYLDMLSRLLQEKLYYKEGEKDMILLRHKFVVENSDKTRDIITSTLIDFGIPGGDSSMARTVSLPLAIGTRLMAENKIDLKGVQIPDKKELYEPILEELEQLNIKVVETRSPIGDSKLSL